MRPRRAGTQQGVQPVWRANRHQSAGTHHFPFFEDAHAIRALAVAYDMTGKREYLDTCQHWSDRMIAYQDKMDPKGAYYLNYFRKPGQSEKDEMWFISDAGSMAMAVFATAVRCPDNRDKARYLTSVEAFAKLIMADRIGRNGGIIEKLWGGFADEWWCSTATLGAPALQLYEATGKEEYRRVGLAVLRWMIGRNFYDAQVITFRQRPSGVVFYDFELYVAGLKYLPAGSPERKAALAQIAEALRWMAANQIGRGAKPAFAYRNEVTPTWPRSPSSCTPSPTNCRNTGIWCPRPTGNSVTWAACCLTRGIRPSRT